jgi:hypothetical protein
MKITEIFHSTKSLCSNTVPIVDMGVKVKLVLGIIKQEPEVFVSEKMEACNLPEIN